MPPIPRVFRQSSDNVVFNVDYFDFAAGAGYKKYYFCGMKDSTGAIYTLTADTPVADGDNFRIGSGADIDFDLTYNNPIVVAKADAIISTTLNFDGAGAGWHTNIEIFHVRGAVATSLGSVESASHSSAGANYHVQTFKCPLIQYVFKAGDKIRVNVIVTNTSVNGYMWIDPSGHVSGNDAFGFSVSSNSSINIPFKINQ